MAGLQVDKNVEAGLAFAHQDEATVGRGASQPDFNPPPTKKEFHDRSSGEISPVAETVAVRDHTEDVGGRFPTDEELRSLRHIPDHIPFNMYRA
jgi:hypothetical protein